MDILSPIKEIFGRHSYNDTQERTPTKTNQILRGDILIGHTLIAAPALMLEKKVKVDAGGLVDFCTLINALTLHDRLIVLPSRVPLYLQKSTLYRHLINKNIIYELDISYEDLKQDISENVDEIRDFIGNYDLSWKEIEKILVNPLNDPDGIKITSPSLDVYPTIYTDYDHSDEYNTKDKQWTKQRHEFINEIIKHDINTWTLKDYTKMLNPDDQDALSRSRSSIFETAPKTATLMGNEKQLQFHFLRTAAYWQISSIRRIPFAVDFMRIPLIATYNIRVKQVLRTYMQKVIDMAYRKDLETFTTLNACIIPVPPTTMLFIKKYFELGLEKAVDSLRDEFREHRKDIVEWEENITKEDISINELKKIINDRVETSLGTLGKVDASQAILSLDYLDDTEKSFLRKIQEIAGNVNDVGVPLDVKGAVSSIPAIAMKAIDYALATRRRKKVVYFFNVLKEVNSIVNHKDLFRKAFGRTVNDSVLERFSGLSTSLDKLMLPPYER